MCGNSAATASLWGSFIHPAPDHATSIAGFAEYPRNSPPSRLLHHTVSAGSTGSEHAMGVFMLSARCGRSWL